MKMKGESIHVEIEVFVDYKKSLQKLVGNFKTKETH